MEENKSKKERLEDALLEFIEENVKDPLPEAVAAIPAAARVLVELWR